MDNIISRRQEFLILLAAIVASGMAFLDTSVVNVAIPTIQNSFHASFDSMLWVVNAFPLVLASLLLIAGSLYDRFGRKKIFILGIVLFTAASVLCALAQSILQLVVFRALQGLGAAMMIPGSLTIINLSVPEHRRGRAIGLWSGFSGGIAAVGPFIGGWLVQHLSWRAIFYINVPLGIMAGLLTYYAILESRNPQASKLDLWGAFTILLGLFGIAYGLMTAPVLGWQNPVVLASIVGGVASLVVFGFVEKKRREPLIVFSIFKSKLVLGANLVTLFLYGALNSLIFFVVLNLQQIQGFSPIRAGLGLLPAVLIITFFSGRGGSIADRIGPRLPMILGPLLVCLGSVWIMFAGITANYFTMFMPGLVLFGLGMALVIAPLTKSALAVPENYSGSASGINNAVARIAALLAVAILGVVAIAFFNGNLQHQIADTALSGNQKQQILAQSNKLGGIVVPQNFNPAATQTARLAVKISFVHSFRVVLFLTAVLALVSSIISVILIRPRKLGT